jgi:hypothetical protein
MSLSRLVPALVGLALSATPAAAVDLGKIDRRLAKEPDYTARAQKYCLLVFGPEATTRIWIVLDGNVLYVDRQGNGDLTGPGKAVAFPNSSVYVGELVDPLTGAKHNNFRVFRRGDGTMRLMLNLDGKRQFFVGYDRANPLRFADRPGDAPVVHFGGPLTMQLYGPPLAFTPGQEEEVDVMVGTPGLGKGTFAALACCTILDCKVSPLAEVTFPHSQPGKKPLVARAAIADD